MLAGPGVCQVGIRHHPGLAMDCRSTYYEQHISEQFADLMRWAVGALWEGVWNEMQSLWIGMQILFHKTMFVYYTLIIWYCAWLEWFLPKYYASRRVLDEISGQGEDQEENAWRG